jgi:molybdopterin-guanine dinucleotide biosynthesis protein A
MRLGPETPKALRSFGGIPLYERAIRFCRGLTDDVWVSVPTGLELPGPGARVVRDPRAFGPWPGPLVALGWALQGIERPWALVLAVDLPLVRRTLVDFLWAKRGEPSTPAPEAPLAFYRREAGPPLLALASGGERAVVRAVAALPLVRVAEEDWRRADPEARSFENANTPGDWARLEQLLLSEEPGA